MTQGDFNLQTRILLTEIRTVRQKLHKGFDFHIRTQLFSQQVRCF